MLGELEPHRFPTRKGTRVFVPGLFIVHHRSAAFHFSALTTTMSEGERK